MKNRKYIMTELVPVFIMIIFSFISFVYLYNLESVDVLSFNNEEANIRGEWYMIYESEDTQYLVEEEENTQNNNVYDLFNNTRNSVWKWIKIIFSPNYIQNMEWEKSNQTITSNLKIQKIGSAFFVPANENDILTQAQLLELKSGSYPKFKIPNKYLYLFPSEKESVSVPFNKDWIVTTIISNDSVELHDIKHILTRKEIKYLAYTHSECLVPQLAADILAKERLFPISKSWTDYCEFWSSKDYNLSTFERHIFKKQIYSFYEYKHTGIIRKYKS